MKYSYSFPFKLAPGLRKQKNKSNLPLYPLIPIVLYNDSKRTNPIEALIDSGSNNLFLPRRIADFLNLPFLGKEKQGGISGLQDCIVSEVGLIIGRGGRETNLGVVKTAFPETEQNNPVLLGRNPVFEEYQVIFEEYKTRVILIPKEEALKEKKQASKKIKTSKKRKKKKYK